MSVPVFEENRYIKKYDTSNGKLVGHEDECYVFINLYSYIINTKFCGKILEYLIISCIRVTDSDYVKA
jgi:hypothetical protein